MAVQKPKVAPEQIRYANLLQYGAWAGILVLFITYLLYVLGIMDPLIPLTEVPKYWTLSAADFSHHFNTPMGWGWVGLIGKGDFLNFLGIAWLSTLTIIGFLMLVPAYFKKGDKIYAFVALAEVLVLVFAASGILGSGGH